MDVVETTTEGLDQEIAKHAGMFVLVYFGPESQIPQKIAESKKHLQVITVPSNEALKQKLKIQAYPALRVYLGDIHMGNDLVGVDVDYSKAKDGIESWLIPILNRPAPYIAGQPATVATSPGSSPPPSSQPAALPPAVEPSPPTGTPQPSLPPSASALAAQAASEKDDGHIEPATKNTGYMQAILKLAGAGYNPVWIDDLRGPRTRKGVKAYALDHGLATDIKTDELYDILMKRLDTDAAFRHQVYSNATAAVKAGAAIRPENVDMIKAAQTLFNIRKFSDPKNPLAVDGDAAYSNGNVTETRKIADKVDDALAQEVKDEKQKQQKIIDAERKRLQDEAQIKLDAAQQAAELMETRLTDQLDEKKAELEKIREPEKDAEKIGVTAGNTSPSKDDKLGTDRLVTVFDSVKENVLKSEGKEKNGRFTRDQFIDHGAFLRADSPYIPKTGDVVFFGLMSRKVSAIESINTNEAGRKIAVFADGKGEKHEIDITKLEENAKTGQSSRHYLKTIAGIDGFGDTERMLRDKTKEFSHEAAAVTGTSGTTTPQDFPPREERPRGRPAPEAAAPPPG